jgi:hypothetical protein
MYNINMSIIVLQADMNQVGRKSPLIAIGAHLT